MWLKIKEKETSVGALTSSPQVIDPPSSSCQWIVSYLWKLMGDFNSCWFWTFQATYDCLYLCLWLLIQIYSRTLCLSDIYLVHTLNLHSTTFVTQCKQMNWLGHHGHIWLSKYKTYVWSNSATSHSNWSGNILSLWCSSVPLAIVSMHGRVGLSRQQILVNAWLQMPTQTNSYLLQSPTYCCCISKYLLN